jgi:hypothetical protein
MRPQSILCRPQDQGGAIHARIGYRLAHVLIVVNENAEIHPFYRGIAIRHFDLALQIGGS